MKGFLVQLAAIFIVTVMINSMPGEGIHDYLRTLSRQDLENWSLCAERYHREVYNQTLIIGGLHDRIRELPNDFLVSYLIQETKEHKEMDSVYFFKSLLFKYDFTKTVPDEDIDGAGVHDHLQSLKRKELLVWALAAEKYHREFYNLTFIMGGLHDRVNTISRDELIDYLTREVSEHPEMNSVQFFQNLIRKYDVQHFKGLGEGVHDYVQALSRRDLINWGLAAERYHKEAYNMTFIMGGLHDRIDSITREELIDYILSEVEEHEEMDSVEFFRNLIGQYAISRKGKLLGGGIHDYVMALTRRELLDWALAAEKYHQISYNITFILGGLHDRTDTITRQELINYLYKEVEEHPEMNSVEFFRNIVETYGFSVRITNRKLGGGIHDYVRTLSRRELISWALAAENYHKEAYNMTFIFGGIHDRVDSISREELMTYIFQEVRDHPEMNSVEFFNKKISQYSLYRERRIGGGIHDHIQAMNRTDLLEWAFAAERYHRDAYNQSFIMGGLHDRANTITREELISYLLREKDEHPEMDSVQFFNTLLKKYNYVQQKRLGEGVHDHLISLTRKELIYWALAAEAYHKEAYNMSFIMGGLHDRIITIKKEELINYILKEVEEHQEMDSLNFFNTIIAKYNIIPVQPRGSGIHDIVRTLSRNELESFALASERYHRTVFSLTLMGGLHDYISRVSNQELTEYIFNEVEDHPELNNIKFFRNLLNEYGLHSDTIDNNSEIDGGIEDYLHTLPRDLLAKWALAVEKYVREVKKVPIRGGIHDYIDRLEAKDIADYIVKMSRKYPELNSREFLEQISK